MNESKNVEGILFIASCLLLSTLVVIAIDISTEMVIKKDLKKRLAFEKLIRDMNAVPDDITESYKSGRIETHNCSECVTDDEC